jgi:hypothetical protein
MAARLPSVATEGNAAQRFLSVSATFCLLTCFLWREILT